MKFRRLGRSGPDISVVAYGLMGLSQTYGPSDDAESLDTIHAAIDAGINLLDTAEVYGMGHNERLFSEILQKRRHEVVVASKFGLEFADGAMRANGRPENARRAIEGSLDRLGIETVDLYYLHRLDPEVPIEETVGTMARFVDEGKVRHLGLSEVNSETLRRASKESPIAALQSEYSVFQRAPEDGVLETCQELGTTFVAFSPLGRGLLTGTLRNAEDLGERDMRRHSPQLEATNLEHNLVVVDSFVRLAKEHELEPSQLALAWVLEQGAVPLFGTRRAARVRANLEAIGTQMDRALLGRIEKIAPAGAIMGTGIPEAMEELKQR
ncbi:MAG: aldo/keto reductase [bacterium]|nr:aldo/keto reductase [Deltaproteobacteria bacterium]MCP4905217.1 aldo/keto reductase [bacterium]